MAKKYRPHRVSGDFKKGENGEAQVRLSKDKKKIQVRFEETKNKYTFRRTKSIKQLLPGRTWFIQLNGDEDEVFNFHPWSGQFRGKVQGFASKEGESPAPSVNERSYEGQKYQTVDFTAIVEITEPKKVAGITIPHFLRYNFREYMNEDGKSEVGLAAKGSRTKQLADFLDITGAWVQGPMKWKDNVLPAVERRILRQAREFNFIIKDGWIDTLFSADEPEVEDADWDEEDEPVEESAPDDDDEIDWEMDE
jgi:hypothetical protein